jgi:hypothetical protein
MFEAKIYIFCPSFYWYFLKNKNCIFLHKNGHFSLKNDHFSSEKCNFHFFKKNTNKKKDKKNVLLL